MQILLLHDLHLMIKESMHGVFEKEAGKQACT